MNTTELIPTPPAQRWREFRFKALPVIVFGCALAAVIILWHNNVSAPTMTGEVATVSANVIAPESGVLTNVLVGRFQKVKAGQEIACVLASNPAKIDSQLGLIRGNITLNQFDLNAFLDRHRLAFNNAELRLNYMKQRVELATSQVELQRAEAELLRFQQLTNQNLVSPSQYDVALKNRDIFKRKVDETEKLLADMEIGVAEGKQAEEQFPKIRNLPTDTLLAIEKQRQHLLSLPNEPLLLRSPIDGVVTAIHRRNGENVLAGDPIVTITAATGERIVGYLRQPLVVEPHIGMQVEVRARSLRRETSMAHITDVGSAMEHVSTNLLAPGLRGEIGLAIAVNMPPGLTLRPGELVDLILKPQR